MAADFEAAPAAIFGKLFPDYAFNDCEVKYSAYVAGAYIYARMCRRPEPPKKAAKGKKVKRNENRPC